MPTLMPERLRKNLTLKKPPIRSIPPASYRYYLSVLAIFKNEAMNIKVWVDHYLWMGVDHFFLIDNGSDDDSQKILKPYIDKGVVSVFYMPEKWKQVEHYRHIFEHHIKNKSKWVIVADLDEFWYVKNSTIRKELPKYENYDVILSNWRMFGTDGHIEHPKDIRTAIVHRRKELDQHTKYIFQSRKIKTEQVWIHNPLGDVHKKINASNIFLLNHYPIQSEEFFQKVKMTRGSASTLKHENVRNHEYFQRYNSGTTFLDTDLKGMVEKSFLSFLLNK